MKTYLSQKSKHRVLNESSKKLVLIEVQTGSKFLESDIKDTQIFMEEKLKILAEISVGELFDKITILNIKLKKLMILRN